MAVDYQKSYVLMWVGTIAGFVLMLIGGVLAINWLGCPGRHSPLLPGVRGVHLVGR